MNVLQIINLGDRVEPVEAPGNFGTVVDFKENEEYGLIAVYVKWDKYDADDPLKGLFPYYSEKIRKVSRHK